MLLLQIFEKFIRKLYNLGSKTFETDFSCGGKCLKRASTTNTQTEAKVTTG